MDRFNELKVFVSVAESGGFAKAAARLRSSPPAVTRTVAALEQRVGVQLFNRTTRMVSMTEAGRRFLEHARRILTDLDVAESELAGESTMPSGHLTITSPVTMGRMMLPSIVTDFLHAHPHVTAKVLLFDRITNLIEEGIDVGLRVGQLPDSSLIARQVGEVRRILVASPAYLSKHGRPKDPTDLKRHSMIAFTGLLPSREWVFGEAKTARRITLKPRFEINDAAAAIAAAEGGGGITIALSYMVARQIGERRLQQVLGSFAPSAVPVQLVYPESRLVAPKVRAFVDYAAPKLRSALRGLNPSAKRSAAAPRRR
ncbi:MAG: LysR family transcriptional regulator [Hyphomicrobiaceae bacterium]|nr:LysR family transcriptional regulator [Hyphomicrobiaceae bacterium]